MAADAKTLEFYDRCAAEYAIWSSETSGREHLHRFIGLLPQGGAALDLGCGSGWAAVEMVTRGLLVKAMDGSPALATQARETFGLEVAVALFSDLAADSEFDGIWCSFSLLHAPRSEMPENLSRIFRALKAGGWVYLGLKGGTGASRDRLGRFYQFYEAEEISGLLSDAGFIVSDVAAEMSEGYEGARSPVLHLFARKSDV